MRPLPFVSGLAPFLRRSLACLTVLVVTLGPLRLARAQAPGTLPQGAAGLSAASTGKTDLVTGRVAAAVRRPEELKDETAITVGAGGLFLSGNSRQFAATGRFDMRLRRSVHQLTASSASNFARAGKPGQGTETSAENVQGLLRYDWFFSEHWSLFYQSTARYDRFQGLDLRLSIDPGLAHYFVAEKETRVWLELGYDGQYDIRRDDARVVAGQPPLPKAQFLNNLRVFLGYNNHFSESVSAILDFEFIQDISDHERFRFVFDAGVQAKIVNKLSVATTFTVRYENRPLPGVQNTDTTGSVNLVYTLL